MEKLALWTNAEWTDTVGDGFTPWLETYLLDTSEPLGAVIVCPGGGYAGRADHEAEPIARRYNELGYHAFVCHYSVNPRLHPQPIRDLSRAFRLVRSRASEWKVAPDKLAALGFSAGGHLAASLGVHWDKPFCADEGPLGDFSNEPNALILCYAVIGGGPGGHQGSIVNLMRPEPTAAERWLTQLDLHVTPKTAPTFMWSTSDDQAVAVENSLRFATAISQAGGTFELHVYPRGAHGLGLAPGDPHIATWSGLSGDWLEGLGWARKA